MRQFILFGHLLHKPVSQRQGDLVHTTLHIEADRDCERPRRFFVKVVTDDAQLIAEDHRVGDVVFARGEIDTDENGAHLELIADWLTFFDQPG